MLAAAFRGGTAWQAASLSQNRHAIGVISGNQKKDNPLNGRGIGELLRLTLPVGFAGLSVELESLGSKNEFAIWGSNDGTGLDTPLTSGVGGGGVDLISLPESDYRHRIFGIPQGEKASYRVKSLTAEARQAVSAKNSTEVSEPYAFALFGVGLIGLYLMRRRRDTAAGPV